MSRLYAEIISDSGSRTITRTGHQMMQAHIRGWNVGVMVVAEIYDGELFLTVKKTGGSNNPEAGSWSKTIKGKV